MKNKGYDTHHLYPRSRNHRLARVDWNRRKMRKNLHASWHVLVGNATPIEGLLRIWELFVPKEALAMEPDKVEQLKRLLG